MRNTSARDAGSIASIIGSPAGGQPFRFTVTDEGRSWSATIYADSEDEAAARFGLVMQAFVKRSLIERIGLWFGKATAFACGILLAIGILALTIRAGIWVGWITL